MKAETIRVEKPVERSAVRWGMQTCKSKKFRHRADRRAKDARRKREEFS